MSALLISPPAAFSTSMLSLSRGITNRLPSSCSTAQQHHSIMGMRRQQQQHPGMKLW